MLKHPTLTGQKIGRFSVLNEIKKGKLIYYECLCDCGKRKIVYKGSLIKGVSKSCGCLNSEMSSARLKTHGQSKTRQHRSWCAMNERCSNSNRKAFNDYGGRGIRVCERYRNSYLDYLSDLGEKPSPKHTVDRIDNNKNYSCGKCEECLRNGWGMNIHWATVGEQTRNKRNNIWLEYNGERMIMADWARRFGVNRTPLQRYIKRHSVEEAMEHYLHRLPV